MEDDPHGSSEEFLIPFICMVGATEAEEMEQFYVVNSRAKSVRTDLAFALFASCPIAILKCSNVSKRKGGIGRFSPRSWSRSLPMQRGLARSYPAGRDRQAGHYMPSASIVTSLKPLLASSFFSRLSFEQQQQVIEAFWTGLREVMRPAFDEPHDFVVQKGVGVIVLHAILVDVIEIARSLGHSVVDAATYTSIMAKPIDTLQGDAQDGLVRLFKAFRSGAPPRRELQVPTAPGRPSRADLEDLAASPESGGRLMGRRAASSGVTLDVVDAAIVKGCSLGGIGSTTSLLVRCERWSDRPDATGAKFPNVTAANASSLPPRGP